MLDTNVVVSGLLWAGRPAELLRTAVTLPVRFVASEQLLLELRQSLGKPKFAKQIAKMGLTVKEHAENYRSLVELVTHGGLTSPVSRDPDDDLILACALAANADLIATGDDDLLVLGAWQGIPILKVRECLELITVSMNGGLRD